MIDLKEWVGVVMSVCGQFIDLIVDFKVILGVFVFVNDFGSLLV